MTKSYLITLTPTGKFFFGGEMTFKVEGEDEKYNNQYSSYIIESNKMPQQTSLLGMLRFLILKNAGKDVFDNGRITSADKASNLIGGSSFSVNSQHSRNNFGTIECIMPCFLMEDEKPANVFCIVNPDKFHMDDADNTICTINGQEVCVPKNDYNPKESSSNPLDEYFKFDQRIGLKKDYEGKNKQKDDDTDLFKQINMRFNDDKNLRFAFYAKVDEQIPLSDYDGQIVTLGADGSTFIINIMESDYSEAEIDKMPLGNAIILTSPAYIESKHLASVTFATTSVIPFRFLGTTVNTRSYNRLGGEIKQGTKYNLYDTGSVFYFAGTEEMNKFAKELCDYENFRQIGYNYFIKNK